VCHEQQTSLTASNVKVIEQNRNYRVGHRQGSRGSNRSKHRAMHDHEEPRPTCLPRWYLPVEQGVIEMAEDYESMTVAQLKELLKEQDLPVSGKKSDLIARLQMLRATPKRSVKKQRHPKRHAVEDSWDDEDWDDETEDVYMVKQKPVLNDEMKAALALRSAQKKKTPSFRRTEWFRYKRLSRSGWRAPHGMDNKQRRNYKYRGSLVRIGHGKVAAARFLHPSGFREVMVHNVSDLEVIDPETEAARVGASVGGRKRETIYSRADELGVRVLNRRRDV